MSLKDTHFSYHEGHDEGKGKTAASFIEHTEKRQLLVLSGEQSDCLNHALTITQNLDCLNLQNLKKANDFLGQEFDAVIFNTFDGFNPNALGAITGTIRAGGFLLLLTPNHWGKESKKESLFLTRFQSLLNLSIDVHFLGLSDKPNALNIPPKISICDTYASLDQQLAVKAIKKVVSGHRRRPLVITADRGRGKSASLGIACAQLLQNGLSNIIVTAPSKKTADVIFQHVEAIYPEASIHFYSPDELLQQKPSAELLLIDEASAIPLPLLESFVTHYSRVVFATTLHGYEGSGQGFTLKFFKTLDALAPDWKHCELKTPIRYAENDPLENFVFKSLLLNSEPAKDNLVKNIKRSDCTVQTVDKASLIENENLLRQLFGLLVSAHYQTKPSDLMMLLDDESLSIHAIISPQQDIVAVALKIKEGGLEEELATHIFQGKRRIKGHLVAQALSANAGIEMAPCLIGERINRIAVHPQLQNTGLGNYLLKSLYEQSNADYLSTSFGANNSLINFWKQAGFTAVYLGMKRDASSGAHSVIMLKGISESGKKLVNDVQLRFSKNFVPLLSEPFKMLEADIAFSLLINMKVATTSHLSKPEKQEIIAFAKHQRGYENTLYSLWKLTCNSLPAKASHLDDIDKKILLHKVLQKKSWKNVVKLLELTGKKEALLLLRESIAKLDPY